MSTDGSENIQLANALKRQKELQGTIRAATDTIKAAMQELDRTRQFINMFRTFTPSSESGAGIGSSAQVVPGSIKLKGHAHGQVQAVFEALALDILRDVGRPMKSTEFIEEFRKRGQPLGGNEVRTAWNRLWQAKKAGSLTYEARFGYWIPDEPLTEEMKLNAIAAAKRNRGKAPSLRDTIGKRKGPPSALTPDQVKEAEHFLLSGKTRKEVCELFGISMVTLAAYVGRTADFVARHPGFVPPKQPYRPPRPGQKRGGRPRTWTEDQERQVLELRVQGKSVREIIETTGVKRTTIYKIFKEHGVEVRESSDEIRTPEDSN
jgi:hypothetical protein